jgi:uncharacterized protein YcsI (UPF0317 family)
MIVFDETYDFDNLCKKLKSLDLSLDRSPSFNFRKAVREGVSDGRSSNVCKGHVQLNLAFISKSNIEDFKNFCLLNPKPFPLIEIGLPGDKSLPISCPLGTDITTDVATYSVTNNKISKVYRGISSLWNDNLIPVAYGCSFSLDQYLICKGWKLKHIIQEKVVSIYETNIPVKPYGVFNKGHYVVTMRAFKKELLEDLLNITKRLKAVHGTPIYYGWDFKENLGIENLNNPRWGDITEFEEDEIPVFWACGLTLVSVLESCDNLELAGVSDGDTLLVSDILTSEIEDIA